MNKYLLPALLFLGIGNIIASEPCPSDAYGQREMDPDVSIAAAQAEIAEILRHELFIRAEGCLSPYLIEFYISEAKENGTPFSKEELSDAIARAKKSQNKSVQCHNVIETLERHEQLAN